MTKLMFCGDCGDLVSPGLKNLDPRWCNCRRHAVWWRNASQGLISVHDGLFPERNGSPGGKAWIVGIHNMLLLMGGFVGDPNTPWLSRTEETGKNTPGNYHTQAAWVKDAVEDTPDTYLFKQAQSLIVRFYPGSTGDSMWEALVPGNISKATLIDVPGSVTVNL